MAIFFLFGGSVQAVQPPLTSVGHFQLQFWNPADGNAVTAGGTVASADMSTWTAAEQAAVVRAFEYWSNRLGAVAAAGGDRPVVRLVKDMTTGPNAHGGGWATVVGPDTVLNTYDRLVNGGTPTRADSGGGDPSDVGCDSSIVFDVGGAWTTDRITQFPSGSYTSQESSFEMIAIHEMAHIVGILTGSSDPYTNNLVTDIEGNEFFRGTPTIDGLFGPEGIPVDGAHTMMEYYNLTRATPFGVDFRNVSYMSPGELAIIRDLGYTGVNINNYFGTIHYRDADESTGAETSGAFASAEDYAVGLYIYSDNHNITQTGDITVTGYAAAGVRIANGMNNTLTIAPGATITANGEQGMGILVSAGEDNRIVHRGVINTTHATGTGIWLDFGPINHSVQVDSGDYNDYLVDTIDITGTINSGGNSIFISDRAAVREINIMRGAAITGDILCDALTNDVLSNPTLTFGRTAGGDGRAVLGTSDALFAMTLNDDILGVTPMNALFAGGTTTLNGSTGFNAIVVDSGATLAGAGTISSEMTILNNGTINNSTSISTVGGELYNYGVFTSDLLSITGDIVNGSATAPATMTLNDTTTAIGGLFNIHGTINANADVDVTEQVQNWSDGELNIASGATVTGLAGVINGGYINGDGTLQAGAPLVPGDMENLINLEDGVIAGGVSLGASDSIGNAGKIATTGSLTATNGSIGNLGVLRSVGATAGTFIVNGDTTHSGTFFADGATTAGDNIANLNGSFYANANVTAGGDVTNGNSVDSTFGEFFVNAPATVSGVNFINDYGLLTVNPGGTIDVTDDFWNNPDSIVRNAGTITAGRDVINIGLIETNSGTISAGRDFWNNSIVASSSGSILATRNVEQNGFLYNTGGIVGADVDVNIRALLISDGGQINAGGAVTVFLGARLAGTPTVNATVLDNRQGATLAPGNISFELTEHKAIGVMRVNGDLQTNGEIEFDLTYEPIPMDGDQILMTGGTAALNNLTGWGDRGTFLFDGAMPSPTDDTSPYDIARRYTIIDTDAADNLQVVQRPQVEDNIDRRRIILRSDTDMEMLYTPNAEDYYAYIGRDIPFEHIGITPNEKAFGAYFDSIKLMDDGTAITNDLQWVRDTLDLILEEDDVRIAMNQMTGEIYGSLSAVGRQRMYGMYGTLASRLRGEGPLHLRQSDDAWDGWYSGFGSGGVVYGDGNAHGYDYTNAGAQATINYTFNSRTTIGGFYNYDSSDFSGDLGDWGGVQSHEWGGYMAHHRADDYILFAASGGMGDYDITRHIHFGNTAIQLPIDRYAVGEFAGSQFGLYAEYGRDYDFRSTNFRPYFGCGYVDVQQDGFEEDGAGVLDLLVENTSLDGFRSSLGVDWETVLNQANRTILNFHGVWIHDFASPNSASVTARFADIPGPTFTVNGANLGHDYAVIGSGISSNIRTEHFRFFAGYDLIVNDHQRQHAGTAGAEAAW
jgi:uncharacterized protein with beta-barrel porin domain